MSKVPRWKSLGINGKRDGTFGTFGTFDTFDQSGTPPEVGSNPFFFSFDDFYSSQSFNS